jgi:hypothetical protein
MEAYWVSTLYYVTVMMERAFLADFTVHPRH